MIPEIKQRIEQIQRGEVPEGYKKEKRYIIPVNWCQKKLSDLGIWVGGGTPAKSNQEYWENGTIYWISSQDVKETILSKTTYKITEKALQESTTNLVPENTIIIVVRSGILQHTLPVAKTKKPMAINQDIKALILNDPTDIDYVINAIKSFDATILKEYTKKGTTVESLLFDAFSNFLIPYALENERAKIAAILVAQDKIIKLKEKLLAEKQRQKKYLMQQLLTGKKRLPGFDGEWKIQPLWKISNKQKKKNSGFQYSLVLSNSAVHGIVSQDQEFDKEIANEERIDGYYIVEPGAFVYNPRISVSAPCGPININETGKTGIMSPLYTVFCISSTEVSTKFLKYYFQSSCWYRYIKGVANYGARHDRISISDGDFFNMPIALPLKEEQIAIAEVLATADHEIDLLQKDIEQEKQKKKALMQLLLTGIVRVKT